MIDIKFLRENPEVVKQNIRNKFQDSKLPLVDEVIALDEQLRQNKKRADDLRANRNKVSKSIGALMGQKKFAEAEEAKKIVSGTARLLLTNDSNSFSGVFSSHATTYPVEDLYDHVYTVSSDGKTNLWHVKSAKKVIKLASNVYSCQLDADAEYVYYTNKSGDLSVLKISHGEKAADKAKELADEVYTYVVTSNRKLVYYISDGELYSCNAKNGKGKKLIADDDLGGNLAITAKNVVFYAYDGDLYACSNGRTGKKILSDPIDLYQCKNGVVYVMDEDSIYVTTGAAKLKKLLDNN